MAFVPDLTLDQRLDGILTPRLFFWARSAHGHTSRTTTSLLWSVGGNQRLSAELPSPSGHFRLTFAVVFILLLIRDAFLNTAPLFAKFELPGPVPQEAAFDPRWNRAFDGGGDGVRALLHRAHQGRHALQPAGPGAPLPAGGWTQREELTPVTPPPQHLRPWTSNVWEQGKTFLIICCSCGEDRTGWCE